MESYILIKPNEMHESLVLEMINEIISNNETIIPSALNLNNLSYKEWLSRLKNLESKSTCPEGIVPSNFYLFFNDNRLIGAIDIRTELNDFLLKKGGNIGYGIRPTKRRKGYAKIQLELGLLEAKKLGLEKVLLTCNKENIASSCTIQSCNGVLEDEYSQEDGTITLRYWIALE